MSDEAELVRYSRELAAQLTSDLPVWVERTVASRTDLDLSEPSRRAGVAAAEAVGPRIEALLALDIDEQRTNPLALLRQAVSYPTDVLAEAGVPERQRDEFARRNFPDDPYDLTPASFADISDAAQEAGIRWGAAKAHVHLARRRAEGLR